MSGHYFSTDPVGPGGPGDPPRRRPISVILAGREVEVVTAAGVFSADRLDLGTRVLLREVDPPPATGNLLDLGCGWGPLAMSMALHSPEASVWAVDVNPRAVALTAENAGRLDLRNVRAVAPQEIPNELEFSAIWSNPPIRIGKPALHALLMQWLPRLAPGAAAHLVVQRNLGADSLQAWLTAMLGGQMQVSRLGSSKGYRVLQVLRGA
jgi:16S rRNA (guanine1207-N2)-methyltransferase